MTTIKITEVDDNVSEPKRRNLKSISQFTSIILLYLFFLN